MPENEIAVSVIVYARNAQRTLPRCLRALQSQTLRSSAAMEVIVIDGGSSDRTHEIALEFHVAEPDFIRVHRLNSADAFCAEQTGLALARGKYVAFHDVNAVAPPEIYHALYVYCEKNNADFAGAKIWGRTLRGMLARREFLLSHSLPVKTGYDRAEQLAAYDTLRALVSPDDLPLFCADWVKILRGICLEEYRKSKSGAAFYERMISLAEEPQVEEAMALAERNALDRGHKRFFDAFRARNWVAVEGKLRNSRLPWRGVRPSPPAGWCGTCPIRFRLSRRRAGPRPAPCRGTPRRG